MPKSFTKKKSSPLSSGVTALTAVFLLGCFLVFLLPVVVEAVFQRQLSKATTLPVEIGKVHFSLRRPQFSIYEIEVSNPKDFPSGLLAQVGEARVQYAPTGKFVGGFELKKIEIDFKDFRLIRNEKGILNLPTFPPSESRHLINEVILNLGSVTYTDLSSGQPSQQTFDLALSKALYRNIKGISGILEILNWEILKRTGVEEKLKTSLSEIKPIGGSPVAVQTASEAVPSLAPAPSSKPSEPSPALSAPKAG